MSGAYILDVHEYNRIRALVKTDKRQAISELCKACNCTVKEADRFLFGMFGI